VITKTFNIGTDRAPGMVAELNAAGVIWTECPRKWASWFIVTGTPEQVATVAARVGLVTQ
jgi:hypothetical protein